MKEPATSEIMKVRRSPSYDSLRSACSSNSTSSNKPCDVLFDNLRVLPLPSNTHHQRSPSCNSLQSSFSLNSTFSNKPTDVLYDKPKGLPLISSPHHQRSISYNSLRFSCSIDSTSNKPSDVLYDRPKGLPLSSYSRDPNAKQCELNASVMKRLRSESMPSASLNPVDDRPYSTEPVLKAEASTVDDRKKADSEHQGIRDNQSLNTGVSSSNVSQNAHIAVGKSFITSASMKVNIENYRYTQLLNILISDSILTIVYQLDLATVDI